MSKLTTTLIAGLGIIATALPAAAQAAPWQSVNQRQARIEARIDQGIRTGALTRREAVSLRSQFNALSQLEYRYRRSGGGLSVGERRDLDRRFDVLSAKVRMQKHDRQDRRWR